jgi:hypothetical protein
MLQKVLLSPLFCLLAHLVLLHWVSW